MKFMGFEVQESSAVPPGTILIGDRREFERLLAKAEDDVINKLWATGLFTEVGRGAIIEEIEAAARCYVRQKWDSVADDLAGRTGIDDAGLRTIEDGAYVG